MSLRVLIAILFALGGAIAQTGYAQETFYGHVGASFGRARLDADCPGTGGECDRTQNAWKVFAGSRFNKWFGGELSYLRADNFKRGGGDTDVALVNLSVLAGIPFGLNSGIYLKGGALWGHTEATGPALGLDAGSQNGWGPSFGLGAQMGITRNWAVRLDLDRYRPKFPGGAGRANLDTSMLGVQYSLGGS
jgi:hypothetical protein